MRTGLSPGKDEGHRQVPSEVYKMLYTGDTLARRQRSRKKSGVAKMAHHEGMSHVAA